MRILIVEDDKSILDLLKLYLCEMEENECGFAKNNDEAIKYIENHNPDAILLDLLLEDGYAIPILTYLQKRTSYHPKVIMFSALRQAQQVMNNFNIEYYLNKPFDIDELHNILFN